MSVNTITDWTTFTPATRVGWNGSYISIPAFAYSSLDFNAVSQIVTQYGYSASANFYLVARPTKPVGADYMLVIKYRVGTTVYRYRLWDDVNFTGVAELYNGNIIKVNFVLEVWSLAGSSTVTGAAMSISTTIRSLPTDFRTGIGTTSLGVGAESYVYTQSLTPASGWSYRWRSVEEYLTLEKIATLGGYEDYMFVNGWLDYSGASNLVPVAAGHPFWIRNRLLGFPAVYSFYQVFDGLKASMSLNGTNGVTLYFVFSPTSGMLAGRNLIQIKNSGSADRVTVQASAADSVVVIGSSSSPVIPVNTAKWHFLQVDIYASGAIIAKLNGGATTYTAPGNAIALFNEIYLFNDYLVSIDDAAVDIAEVILYPSIMSSAQTNAYLLTYHAQITFPYTFPTNQAWLDNT